MILIHVPMIIDDLATCSPEGQERGQERGKEKRKESDLGNRWYLS